MPHGREDKSGLSQAAGKQRRAAPRNQSLPSQMCWHAEGTAIPEVSNACRRSGGGHVLGGMGWGRVLAVVGPRWGRGGRGKRVGGDARGVACPNMGDLASSRTVIALSRAGAPYKIAAIDGGQRGEGSSVIRRWREISSRDSWAPHAIAPNHRRSSARNSQRPKATRTAVGSNGSWTRRREASCEHASIAAGRSNGWAQQPHGRSEASTTAANQKRYLW